MQLRAEVVYGLPVMNALTLDEKLSGVEQHQGGREDNLLALIKLQQFVHMYTVCNTHAHAHTCKY